MTARSGFLPCASGQWVGLAG